MALAGTGGSNGVLLALIGFVILFMFPIIPAFPSVHADLNQDKQALLDFIAGTHHARVLNWRQDTPVCNSWTGVACSDDRSRVVSLRLPGRGLRGMIPSNTLTRLSAVQIISLRFNSLSGPLPPDFSVWENLTVLDLSNNGFNGSIPDSISKLRSISALNLANNSLSGEVPDLNIPSLKWINLANNKLNGTVPKSLERFPSWAFRGNNLTFEAGATGSQGTWIGKLSDPALLAITLAALAVGFVISSLLVITCCSSDRIDSQTSSNSKKGGSLGTQPTHRSPERDRKIMSLEGFRYSLRLDNLLKLPAEVLGKGTFGHTYKAVLKDRNEVAVKWVAELGATTTDFEQLMKAVRELGHENIMALKAYYCSRDEKLLIYDYYSKGSMSSVLHGKAAHLRWDCRLKIAVGAARGLAYIHAQKLVHGNVKASNIFFDTGGFRCVSDIGLTTLSNPILPASLRAAGYRAPEAMDTRKPTHESDVYSFGIILLELLTGKSPTQTTGQIHLARWVKSVVQVGWSGEVFDMELLRCPNIEEELIEMLRIGLACVAMTPEERPKMQEVTGMIEDVYRASENRISAVC